MMAPWNELSEREKLICNIWEYYKDVHNVRPRHVDFNSMTDDELKELYRKLCYNFALTD